MTEKRIPLAVLAAIAGTLLSWSSAFVVIRATLGVFDPVELALLRQLVAVPLLALLLIGKKWVTPNRREWLLISVFGLGWFTTYIIALNTAEQTIDAGTASFIVNIGPLLIAVGAWRFLGESLPRNLIAGAVISLSGVGLIAWATSSSGEFSPIGVVWALVATAMYAIGVLTQKPALTRISSAQVTFLGGGNFRNPARRMDPPGCVDRRHGPYWRDSRRCLAGRNPHSSRIRALGILTHPNAGRSSRCVYLPRPAARCC